MFNTRKINFTFLSFTLLFAATACFSCRKGNIAAVPMPAADSNSAQAACDYNTAGVYKGVFCGYHSGNFVLLLANGNDKVQAIVNYNNVCDTLYTQDLLGWQPGNLVSAIFSSISGKGISLDVQILNSDGDSINVKAKNLSDTADKIFAAGLKEFSTIPVHSFEGTYRYNDSTNETYKPDGKWNFVLRGTGINGIMYDNSIHSFRKLKGSNGQGNWQSDSVSRSFTFGPTSNYMTGNFSYNGVVVGSYQTQKTL